MMGPVSKRDLWMVGIAGALAVNVVVAFHIYAAGRQSVALASTRDSLAVVVKERAVIQRQRDSVGKALAEAEKKSAETRTVYVSTKDNAKVVGDAVYDSTGALIQVVDHRIAERIQAADAHVTRLEAELRTAKFALRVDTVFIAKQGEETGLNKKIAKMVEGPRCGRTCGIAIGISTTVAAIWTASQLSKLRQ